MMREDDTLHASSTRDFSQDAWNRSWRHLEMRPGRVPGCVFFEDVLAVKFGLVLRRC